MIREFKEKDAAAIAGIVSEAFSDEVLIGMSKLTAEEIVESSKHQGVKIFVCENEKDGVVGFLTMIEEA